MQFTAVFQKMPEGYIGFVEELPGANTQGRTLEEARAHLAEAVELVLEANRVLSTRAPYWSKHGVPKCRIDLGPSLWPRAGGFAHPVKLLCEA